METANDSKLTGRCFMQYKEALNVQVGDLLHLKYDNYRETHVLRIDHNRQFHLITYHCTSGTYTHKEVSFPLSNEERAKRFINNSKTRVFIRRNHDLGEWLYSVVVEDSDDFWLASFETKEEAERYIAENELKISDREGRVAE